MRSCFRHFFLAFLLLSAGVAAAQQPTTVTGWRLQDTAKVDEPGESISQPGFKANGWYPAVVPGTVLTTLVKAGVYPEPLYGENNRLIPEKLAHSSFWYRTEIKIPAFAAGRHSLLRFEGINYLAEVFVNGHDLGPIKGAFVRGEFDVSQFVKPGSVAGIAVHINPPPHPGRVYEQTVANGTGPNGGAMGQDGPTFVATVGWDWMPGIRDRDMGIWQNVKLDIVGDVVIRDPYVRTDFDVAHPTKATIHEELTLDNLSSHSVSCLPLGIVKETGQVSQQSVTLAPHEKRKVSLPAVEIAQPNLWWPNGYGKQPLYHLHLAIESGGPRAGEGYDLDSADFKFGIKKYEYFLPGSKNLAVIVNGVPIMCKGGNWGLDEAMKRIPYKRLEAQIRMHRDAHCTMIRNWVGQCTEEDFYDLCDRYGIMVWDDFWLANPADGPIPNDNGLFMRNAREKVLRFRNHPSIAVWCGRNEANPPPVLNAGLRDLIAELDPVRFYQPHSAAINGVGGGGPYATRPVSFYFNPTDGIHTEIGLPSIPTLESIQGMMPQKDWSPDWKKLNDDYAEHDLTRGAQDGQRFPRNLALRYGPISNLADFVRKSQLANYEGYRAVFEGRNAKLFNPATGVLLWMSSPAQPSFVWQLYSYDLEPNSALFGTQKGCEPIHIQYNPLEESIEVVNNSPKPLPHVRARMSVYDASGKKRLQRETMLDASPSAVQRAFKLNPIDLTAKLQFLKLQLIDNRDRVLSDNFYWEPSTQEPNQLSAMQDLPVVPLDISTRLLSSDPGVTKFAVTLSNNTNHIAVAAHLQLRRRYSGRRVLPVFYSDNYVSLVPGESRNVIIEAASADFEREPILVVLDGWNVKVGAVAPGSVTTLTNEAMKPGKTMPPAVVVPNPPGVVLSLACGSDDLTGTYFVSDDSFVRGGFGNTQTGEIDTAAAGSSAGPKLLYLSERYGEMTYRLPLPALPEGQHYTVRLHFAELSQPRIGGRLFNVDINGTRVLNEFDIFAESGGTGKVLIKDFKVDALNARGNIQITFTRGSANEPEIRAIQVLK